MSHFMPELQTPKDLFLLEGISHLVFNKDNTECALSKKDNKIYLYKTPNPKNYKTWKLYDTLDQHTQYISGLDWNPITNKIISASYDKTSIIWTYEEDKWGGEHPEASFPKLGFLFAYWNTDGTKYVEGTSSSNLFIGYFNEESGWWNVASIKHHKSSVTSARIDSSSLFVISGSIDNSIYITSCYIKLIDDALLPSSSLEHACEFGTVVFKYDASAWTSATNWSLNGAFAFAATYLSEIIVYETASQKESVIQCEHAPVVFIANVDECRFVAVTYDREIFVYEFKEGEWRVEREVKGEKEEEEEEGSRKGVAEELKKYHSSVLKERSSLVVKTEKKDVHLAKVSSVNVIDGKMLVTSDVAGFVKVWKLEGNK